MFSYNGIRIRLVVCVLCAVFVNGMLFAGTLHLKDGKEWEDISGTPEGKRLMAVSKFKRLINSGSVESALDELISLKQSTPEVAGPDFDKFVEGEFLYADGKWFKAVRKYDELLDGWPKSWLFDTAMERNFSICSLIDELLFIRRRFGSSVCRGTGGKECGRDFRLLCKRCGYRS